MIPTTETGRPYAAVRESSGVQRCVLQTFGLDSVLNELKVAVAGPGTFRLPQHIFPILRYDSREVLEQTG